MSETGGVWAASENVDNLGVYGEVWSVSCAKAGSCSAGGWYADGGGAGTHDRGIGEGAGGMIEMSFRGQSFRISEVRTSEPRNLRLNLGRLIRSLCHIYGSDPVAPPPELSRPPWEGGFSYPPSHDARCAPG